MSVGGVLEDLPPNEEALIPVWETSHRIAEERTKLDDSEPGTGGINRESPDRGLGVFVVHELRECPASGRGHSDVGMEKTEPLAIRDTRAGIQLQGPTSWRTHDACPCLARYVDSPILRPAIDHDDVEREIDRLQILKNPGEGVSFVERRNDDTDSAHGRCALNTAVSFNVQS